MADSDVKACLASMVSPFPSISSSEGFEAAADGP